MTDLFMIVGEQRSGTIMLGDLLNSHPQIHVSSEIFLNWPQEYDSYFRFLSRRIAESPAAIYPEYKTISANIAAFLSELSDKYRVPVLGFHVKYDQFGYVPELLKVLGDMKIRIVHNIRRNCLRTLISQKALVQRVTFKMPAHTGVSSEEEEFRILLPDAEVMLTEILSLMVRIERQRAILSSYPNYTEIFHEDVVSSAKPWYLDRLQNFLGVKPAELGSTIRKSSARHSSRDNFENPEQFERLLYLLRNVGYYVE